MDEPNPPWVVPGMRSTIAIISAAVVANFVLGFIVISALLPEQTRAGIEIKHLLGTSVLCMPLHGFRSSSALPLPSIANGTELCM